MPTIMTVLGTRPEIVRLSRIIPALDQALDHVLVHTGQNSGPSLCGVFFQEFGLRAPDIALDCPVSSPAAALGAIFRGVEQAIQNHRPDAMLILGDTNSALSCLIARRHGVPVYHMEAGNRCFDRESPEEANRRVVDHTSDVNLPYTEAARRNLLREGLPPQRIYVTGSPLREVIEHFRPQIDASDALARVGVAAGGYLLASLHRQETVDRPERLTGLVESLGRLHRATGLEVVVSTHPRTQDRLHHAKIVAPDGVRLAEPFGFFDWCRLQSDAACVISDSGTVAEEAAMLKFRAVTPRRAMERPEALEHGGVVLCGIDPDAIVRATMLALAAPLPAHLPPEYAVLDVSRRVLGLIAGTWPLLRGWG
jgi:UDP-N-acetylglucosamine 2-epimerase